MVSNFDIAIAFVMITVFAVLVVLLDYSDDR